MSTRKFRESQERPYSPPGLSTVQPWEEHTHRDAGPGRWGRPVGGLPGPWSRGPSVPRPQPLAHQALPQGERGREVELLASQGWEPKGPQAALGRSGAPTWGRLTHPAP